jgi:hypothetical protein
MKHYFSFTINQYQQKNTASRTQLFFAMKEELYYMIAGYINTLQALWITK